MTDHKIAHLNNIIGVQMIFLACIEVVSFIAAAFVNQRIGNAYVSHACQKINEEGSITHATRRYH